MSKIVQAINSMITNKEYLFNVERSDVSNGEEYFFEYRGRYVWSVFKRHDDEFWVYYYPHAGSSAEASAAGYHANNPVMAYSDSELGSREARESVAELFGILKTKVYNIDAVLDDIISDDIPF